jgi:hypothetical protein
MIPFVKGDLYLGNEFLGTIEAEELPLAENGGIHYGYWFLPPRLLEVAGQYELRGAGQDNRSRRIIYIRQIDPNGKVQAGPVELLG